MFSETPPPDITEAYLAGLEKQQLIDLLYNATNRLLAAMKSHLIDPAYLKSLEKDIQLIQQAIDKRKN